MTFYLSAYRRQPASPYLLGRVRLTDDEVQADLNVGLNVIRVDAEKQRMTLYPFGYSYLITDSEWLRWQVLQDADAISIESSGICYRFYQSSGGDATLVTGLACNANCVMCPVSEAARRHAQLTSVRELEEELRYLGSEIPHITITGGEPTLLKCDLVELLDVAKSQCPRAELLILTNGRAFSVPSYAKVISSHLTAKDQVAIPLHGADARLHDTITQTPGSFEQTLQGLKYLSDGAMRIEIRVVISKMNTHAVADIADMILCLPRVTIVNFVALEMCGNAIKNRNRIWIEYPEAAAACEAAIQKLVMSGIDVGLYNFPLCAVDHKYWTLCRDSISDYKVRYTEDCVRCRVRDICFGAFESTISTGCFHAHPVLE